ncbi:nonstructural protein [Blackfly microvirus SF02]|uniref:Nonstructural protein n=1 Tax=Blackfly microvirus SF02 TaxID=2576452 RepID=A0A4P8PTF4_9VIRU|nr:nonstructural protein [Blackfly microvirus SF02]
MAKVQIYSVFDGAVSAYIQPFYARTKGEAIRMFSQAVNDPQSQLAKHYLDYTMFYLGEFDDGSGLFLPVTVPQRVLAATECRDGEDLVLPPSR